MKKFTKTVVASMVVASMALSMSACSLGGGKSDAVKEAADEYFSKVVAGKDVSKLVEESKKDSEAAELTDYQEDVLKAILKNAEYEITEVSGSEKDEEGEATIEFKYVDAEKLAEDVDADDLLDEIKKADDKESKEFTIEFVYDDEEWLVASKSNAKVQDFINGLVDEIKGGDAVVTEPSETTDDTEPVETTEEPTEPVITDATDATDATGDTTAPAAPASGDADFVNFDDPSFYVNGKKYVLGVTTLQQMIDDGVPFESTSNAGNNVDPNHGTSFKIKLDDGYWTATIDVMNDTDAGIKASECYVSDISFRNEKDKTQNIITFNFPLNCTPDQIKAAEGNPDDEYFNNDDPSWVANYLTYTKKTSSKYYNQSRFEFDFYNNELHTVRMTYVR